MPIEEGGPQAMAPKRPAPAFMGTAVVNDEFQQIKLADYAGKWLVLFFYPLDFTFVCPTEICAFSDRANEFREINCELVACSVDSHHVHLKYSRTARRDGGIQPVQIPLLSDLDQTIGKAYGVYLPEEGHTLRGLFVIDPNGIVRHITMNDMPVGRDVDEVLRVVKAFQYADEHGEVCPANWRPGKPTLVDDAFSAKSAEFFQTHHQ